MQCRAGSGSRPASGPVISGVRQPFGVSAAACHSPTHPACLPAYSICADVEIPYVDAILRCLATLASFLARPDWCHSLSTVAADVEISYVDAILGTTVKVTTLGSDALGEVDLKIPAGTQPGTTLVMSKRGVPKLGQPNARGDHLVHVKVSFSVCSSLLVGGVLVGGWDGWVALMGAATWCLLELLALLAGSGE